MTEQSKTYCVMPHIGLALQNNGDFCCCNVNPLSFKDKNNKVMFVHQDRLKDSWTSPTRKFLQDSLDSGKRIKECRHCWDLEDAGQQSPRQHLNERFNHLTPNSTQPKIFILKPGNTCNLGCRMCNPATSSNWYKDAHKMDVNRGRFIGTLKEYTKNFEHIRNSFNEDNPFWKDFVDWLPEIEFLDIYGGEPFLVSGLFDALEEIKGKGSKNVSLQFHTNAQLVNEKHLDTIKDYKNVRLGVSIDSHIPDQLEYIRHGCDAETVFKNAQKIFTLAEENKNIHTHINITITTINIYYLDEIVENLEKFNVPLSLNFVTGPDQEYDCRHIPDELKEKIKKKLERHSLCKPAVNFLMQKIPTSKIYWHKFWLTTNMLDSIRNQNFEKVFSEFYRDCKDLIPQTP